jgi:hypothetical protein
VRGSMKAVSAYRPRRDVGGFDAPADGRRLAGFLAKRSLRQLPIKGLQDSRSQPLRSALHPRQSGWQGMAGWSWPAGASRSRCPFKGWMAAITAAQPVRKNVSCNAGLALAAHSRASTPSV